MPPLRPTFPGIRMTTLKVWAGLMAGIMAPGSLARHKHDRWTYNNKMALLGFLLESAQRRAGCDVQTLCLLMSISNDVTERYVATNPEDVQIQQRLMAMRQDLSACLTNQAEAQAWADS